MRVASESTSNGPCPSTSSACHPLTRHQLGSTADALLSTPTSRSGGWKRGKKVGGRAGENEAEMSEGGGEGGTQAGRKQGREERRNGGREE
eukprot:2022085-Rhodomonas_salina.1